MARKFITTDIVDPVKAPITEKALRHINEIPNELGASLVKSMIGTYTTGDLIILDGCVVVANIPGTSTVTAGSIYYNGEIYQVDANASISSPSNTLVWQAVNTLVDGAQTTFSDAVAYDFLSIRKLRLVNGASGSGLANYNGATVKYLSSQVNGGFVIDSSTLFTGTSISGIASKHNGMVTYSVGIQATTTTGNGGSFTISVPTGFKAIQQNSGGFGLNPFIGTIDNITDSTNFAIAQGASSDYALTIDASNKLIIALGSGVVMGASKLVRIVFNMTCRAL